MAESITPRFGFAKQSAGTDAWPGRSGFMAILDLIEGNAAMFKTGTYANRGAAGDVGRFYWSTDTKQLLWDNGVAWEDTALAQPVGYAQNFFTAGDVATAGVFLTNIHGANQALKLRQMTAAGTNNHRLVAQRTGHYAVTATVRITGLNNDFPNGWHDARDFEIAIDRNGVTQMMEPVPMGRDATGWVRQKSVTATVELAVGQYVNTAVFVHNAGLATTNTPPAFTSITAQFIA
jgi:hypothetical protein